VSGGLYPTRTRLALLQAISDHEVWRLTLGPTEYWWLGSRVTARCLQFMRVGWVKFENPELDDPQLYLALTDLGRSILDGGAK
jgi:hypothetical protein